MVNYHQEQINSPLFLYSIKIVILERVFTNMKINLHQTDIAGWHISVKLESLDARFWIQFTQTQQRSDMSKECTHWPWCDHVRSSPTSSKTHVAMEAGEYLSMLQKICRNSPTLRMPPCRLHSLSYQGKKSYFSYTTWFYHYVIILNFYGNCNLLIFW